MCRQDFVHCSCGHTALYDYPCELTNSHPLYLRFACENYEIIRKDEKRGCGSGKFYCRENQEGLFFEHVHDMLEEAQVDMSRLKTVYASVEALGAEFTRQNNLRGVSPEKRICHPTYTAISNRFQQVTFQKAETEAKGKVGNTKANPWLCLIMSFQCLHKSEDIKQSALSSMILSGSTTHSERC